MGGAVTATNEENDQAALEALRLARMLNRYAIKYGEVWAAEIVDGLRSVSKDLHIEAGRLADRAVENQS